MRLLPTERFHRDYERLSQEIQGQVDQQLQQLLSNPRHPSLQVKKMRGVPGVWELRVTRGCRLTFQIEGDFYVLRKVGTHDVLRHP
jgi:mRNA-degrading endonuclease RelE of RelBE toxin-antitoxin system